MAKKPARPDSGAHAKATRTRRTSQNSAARKRATTAGGDGKSAQRTRAKATAPDRERHSGATTWHLGHEDFKRLNTEHLHVHDLFWNHIWNQAEQLPDEFEVDCAQLEPIPANGIPTKDGQGFGRADVVYYVPNDTTKTWAEARKLIGWAPRLTILNLESKKAQSPQADAEQLYYYRHGFRVALGLNIHIEQRSFISGTEAPTYPQLQSGGSFNQEPPRHVPCIHVSDLNADRLPSVFYESAAGAVGALAMPNGATLAHVMHAFRRWAVTADEAGTGQRPWLFAMALQLEPKLGTLYKEAMQLTQEANMDPEISAVIKQNWQVMRDYVAGGTQAFDDQDLDDIPRVRERVNSERYEAEARGYDLGQVDSMLQLLQMKSIRLSPTQERRLRKLANGQLPSLAAAYNATSAADFMRRAGLSPARNGRRPNRKK